MRVGVGVVTTTMVVGGTSSTTVLTFGPRGRHWVLRPGQVISLTLDILSGLYRKRLVYDNTITEHALLLTSCDKVVGPMF